MRQIIFALIFTLIFAAAAAAGPQDPTQFGNASKTTVWLGGQNGTINATGNISTQSYVRALSATFSQIANCGKLNTSSDGQLVCDNETDSRYTGGSNISIAGHVISVNGSFLPTSNYSYTANLSLEGRFNASSLYWGVRAVCLSDGTNCADNTSVNATATANLINSNNLSYINNATSTANLINSNNQSFQVLIASNNLSTKNNDTNTAILIKSNNDSVTVNLTALSNLIRLFWPLGNYSQSANLSIEGTFNASQLRQGTTKVCLLDGTGCADNTTVNSTATANLINSNNLSWINNATNTANYLAALNFTILSNNNTINTNLSGLDTRMRSDNLSGNTNATNTAILIKSNNDSVTSNLTATANFIRAYAVPIGNYSQTANISLEGNFNASSIKWGTRNVCLSDGTNCADNTTGAGSNGTALSNLINSNNASVIANTTALSQLIKSNNDSVQANTTALSNLIRSYSVPIGNYSQTANISIEGNFNASTIKWGTRNVCLNDGTNCVDNVTQANTIIVSTNGTINNNLSLIDTRFRSDNTSWINNATTVANLINSNNASWIANATNTAILIASNNISLIPRFTENYWKVSGTSIYNNTAIAVGIGTPAPRGLLQVNGSGLVLNVSTQNNTLLWANSTENYIGTSVGNKFCFDGTPCTHYMLYNGTHTVIV